MSPGDLNGPAPATVDALGKRCSDKVRYPDQLSALVALAHMRRKGRTEKRIYHCRHCRGGWHITGRPKQWRGKQWHIGIA